ncbi:hypothetical protein D1007_27767 [Hordeum vulgare]|nr:hypothetical protein D1007_27767 [Hordeum vulgare]
MEVMEAKERLPKETKGQAKEKDQAWDEMQSVLNKEEVEEVDFLQPYLHLLSPSLIELLRFVNNRHYMFTMVDIINDVNVIKNSGIAYQNLVDIQGQYKIWGRNKHEKDSLVHLAEAIIHPY